MPKLTQRLDRLEKAIDVLGGGGTCRLCYGHPVAAIHVMHEPDPHGPGFRKTGECYLAMDDGDRITDDLRCRECGAEAVQLHLMDIVGIGAKPAGRPVCAV
jgi:hypothetical protein